MQLTEVMPLLDVHICLRIEKNNLWARQLLRHRPKQRDHEVLRARWEEADWEYGYQRAMQFRSECLDVYGGEFFDADMTKDDLKQEVEFYLMKKLGVLTKEHSREFTTQAHVDEIAQLDDRSVGVKVH